MIFTETKLKGAHVIKIEKITDQRGFFARTWDYEIFKQCGMNSNIAQSNISFNKLKGTLRGMHFQNKPHEEAKLIRCTNGSVYEVLVDLRKESDTYLQWIGETLSADTHTMLYVPEGFALGFQTLEDNTELFYQMSHEYVPESSNGIRWNDPKLNISWPLKPTMISEKDKTLNFIN